MINEGAAPFHSVLMTPSQNAATDVQSASVAFACDDKLAEVFDYLAGKILHTEPALSSRYKKDVPMEPLNENVPIKPALLNRFHVLRDTVAWCVFASVVIELDPEYETMLNELRTARLTAGVKPNRKTLPALLADEPDPLPLLYPKIYMFANADEMYDTKQGVRKKKKLLGRHGCGQMTQHVTSLQNFWKMHSNYKFCSFPQFLPTVLRVFL